MRVALLGVVLALAVPGVARAVTCSAAEQRLAAAKLESYTRDAGAARKAAACTVPPPRTAPAYAFGDDVTAPEQAEVRDDVAFALGQLRELAGVTLAPPAIYALDALQTYAASSSLAGAWDTMWLGSDRLLSTRGMSAALAYWTALGAGNEWHEACAKAFGLGVDAWYAEFAAYRATL